MVQHAETLIHDQPTADATISTDHPSETEPAHRKVKTKALRFNEEITIHSIKHVQWERHTGDLPWRIKQRKGTINKDFGNDGTADSHCHCRTGHKLKNIDPAMRSVQEQASWSEVLGAAAKSARIRAVQMFLSTISDYPAIAAAILFRL